MKQSTRDPKLVRVPKSELTLEALRQFYVDVVEEEWKFETFFDLHETLTITQAVVYCNTQRKVDWLADQMCTRGVPVSKLHAELDLEERDLVMRQFGSGSS